MPGTPGTPPLPKASLIFCSKNCLSLSFHDCLVGAFIWRGSQTPRAILWIMVLRCRVKHGFLCINKQGIASTCPVIFVFSQSLAPSMKLFLLYSSFDSNSVFHYMSSEHQLAPWGSSWGVGTNHMIQFFIACQENIIWTSWEHRHLWILTWSAQSPVCSLAWSGIAGMEGEECPAGQREGRKAEGKVSPGQNCPWIFCSKNCSWILLCIWWSGFGHTGVGEAAVGWIPRWAHYLHLQSACLKLITDFLNLIVAFPWSNWIVSDCIHDLCVFEALEDRSMNRILGILVQVWSSEWLPPVDILELKPMVFETPISKAKEISNGPNVTRECSWHDWFLEHPHLPHTHPHPHPHSHHHHHHHHHHHIAPLWARHIAMALHNEGQWGLELRL